MRSSAIILGLLAASASTNAAPAAFLDWFMSNDNELQSPIILEQQEIVKPLVDSEELQSYINAEGLEARANKLYSLAQKSQKKYKHPTRVIGSKGHWSTIGYVMAELVLLLMEFLQRKLLKWIYLHQLQIVNQLLVQSFSLKMKVVMLLISQQKLTVILH
ncbi:unnamed protein product [[Candida] boidinii]|uniref:Unnamed protein product n=1 Tax=Candida boidinii TaxID=5477 RepID=A0ACB5TTN5_CANBO|nr:unnamed protein product [[Candida] boidinii]